MTPKVTSFDLHFAYLNKEISLAQYRARLKDLGWTDVEVDEALDDQDGEQFEMNSDDIDLYRRTK